MGVFDTESGGFQFPPKVGQKKVIKLVSIEKVDEPNGEKNYKTRTKNFGYYHLIDTGSGKMLLNVWKLYFAIKDSGVNLGETIEIDHKGSGEYKITKVTEQKDWT